VLQEFDESILTLGETRAFLVGGKVFGTALNKMPRGGAPIMNLDLPPSERPELTLCALTRIQKRRAEAIGRALARDGALLATVDFVGERVLEINVTSPGMIRWLDEQKNTRVSLAENYWRAVFKN
jgi:glutathione synthase/RimK-type ligase-like ATP-grasp enzyme